MKIFLKHCLKSQLILCLLFIFIRPVFADEQMLRYRGKYTFSHEVNIFCPEINSQCYWISPVTSVQIRQQLKQLSENIAVEPYQSVCVVLQGEIDREAKRNGFAADYDGLIEVYQIFGLCDQTDIVTQGDLKHHRWVLESINGINIELPKQSSNPFNSDSNGQSLSAGSNILYLEFGEQMTVFASMVCNMLAGKAVLRENYISFNISHSNTRDCSSQDQTLKSLLESVLNSEPNITIDSDKNLLLEVENSVLKYQLKDWVY